MTLKSLAVLALALVGCDEDEPTATVEADAAAQVPQAECEGDERRACPDGCADSEQMCIEGRFGPCIAPAEVCDGVDQDCDGRVDEGLTQVCEGPCGGVSLCADGIFGPCLGAAEPAPEICDGLDQDCDGRVDEGPILPHRAELPLPVGARNLHALVWFGEILALIGGGYPNWVVQLTIDGPTVWNVNRFGAFPVPLTAAVVRRGVALAWGDPAGPAQLGLLGEDGVFIREISPLPIENTADFRMIASGERVALAWAQPGEDGPRIFAAVADPVTGLLAHGPLEVAAGMAPQIFVNGEDGFGLLYQAEEGGALFFTRVTVFAEPAFPPVQVADRASVATLNGNYYIEEFPVVFVQDDRLLIQRYSRLGVKLGEEIELAQLPGIGNVHLLRVDRTYGLFYTAGENQTLYAQPIAAGGRPLDEARPVAEGVEALRGVVAGTDYALAWWNGRAVELLGGPLACPEEMPPPE